ncbi:hypothetical protein [Stappia stellulata]|uniref:hypothetical protein n=1 Tax=Stappia stellulata TaxID=71235 RepID=UPI00048F3635|nr:hypothetical protein [Stappia stellulata]
MEATSPTNGGTVEIHQRGAWPFVTRRSFRLHGGKFIWRARQHRKGLVRLPGHETRPFWHRPSYNCWMGLTFAVGASLFMLGSLLSLVPSSLSGLQINCIFFAGSIPFTLAGYLQHFQAANTPAFAGIGVPVEQTEGIRWIGWQPASPGWWCTLAQLIGTIAFNFNTFDAIRPPTGQLAQDFMIWVPGMIGSVCFLVSGYLAYIEAGHAHISFRPRDLDWCIAAINLSGCFAFMIASTLAYVPAVREPAWIPELSNLNLLVGATCFLAGALLLMVEARVDWEKDAYR